MANPHNWKENFIEQANKKLIYTICHGEFNPLLEYFPVTSGEEAKGEKKFITKKLFDLKTTTLEHLQTIVESIEERAASDAPSQI